MDEACPFFFSSTEAINVNKTYRTVWNATTGTWAAAPETARMRTKSKANSTMKSSVTAAVAVMAGVGGGTMSVDAMAQAANGGGSLSLCAPSGSGLTGTTFGGGNTAGTRLTTACGTAIQNFRLSEGHVRSFQLYNNSNVNGGGVGQASAATEAGISGTVDGHLFLLGGSGVHLRGPVDFDSNASMTNHRITNLANGTAGTDAVNLNQLNAAVAATGNPYVDVRGTTAANATGSRSIAIGDGAIARNTAGAGQTNIAIGAAANTAGGFGQIALGENASAQNSAAGGAIAIGRNATTTQRGVAIGDGAMATAWYGVALGDGSLANQQNTVSVGNATLQRRIVNLAAGTNDTDAVNVGQLNTELAKKVDNTYFKVNSTAAGAVVTSTNSIAIGPGASATPAGAVGSNSIAIGNGAAAGGTDSIMIGTNASHSGSGATVVGGNASAMGGGAGVALGVSSSAAGYSSVALGSNTTASGRNSVALGAGSVADAVNTVSVGSAAVQRRVTNVAAGTAATDAVNVSQLTGVTNALGGGAGVGADGSVTQPTYSVAGRDYNNVGDALDAIAASGGDPDAVKYDDATHQAVTLGNAGTPVAIHNVAEGALTATSTDAVNGSQLFATNTRVGDLEGSLRDGGVIDPVTGESLAVVYDGTAKDTVTLKGADGTTLSNVKAGVSDMDAVNVSQLKDSGLIGDDGKSIAAVTYDRNADGSPNYGTVTLGNGAGPTQLKNVAAGVDGTDAVNVNQMNTGLSDLEDRLKGADLRFVKVNADPATGTPALATGALAVAIGSGAQAAGANSLALGSGARVSGTGSVAIGYNSVANQNNVVSVGSVGNERRIVNVADGDVSFQSTDAVNGGQLYAALNDLSTSVSSKTQQAIDSFSSALDEKTKATLNEVNSRASLMDVTDPLVAIEGVRGDNLASLNGADPSTATAAAIGSSTVASGANAVAVGLQSGALSDNSVAIGSFAQTGAGQPYSVAMGSNVQTNGTQAVAMGANAQANADYALAIGNNNVQAIGDSSIALGNGANVRAGATNSIAMGTGANVARNVEGAMALGSGATATTNGGIALGDNALANRANALSIGRAGAERQIVNVAAGTQTTDAVNVGQLTGVTNALGGGAGVGADGSITQPTYSVGGKNYDNVGDALDAIAASGGDPDAVKYDDGTHQAITLGNAGTPVAIHNVAEGALTATSTDAVNGSQLFATNTRVGDLEDSLRDGGVIDPVTGESLAVVYDGTAKDTVTLAGADGTTLSNVKAGVADMDAVNVSQLKGSGLIGDDGKSIAAVTYDRNADGTPNYGSVTLGNGAGPTQIKNVADATDDGDALNLGQLKDAGLVGDDGAGNLTSAAVTYDRNADGTINRDKVTLQGTDGTTLANVKAGVADMDAVNVSQLKDSGLIGDDGKAIAAVTYDDATKSSVTLGGTSATTPVALYNVAEGALTATSTDAVNGSQLFATNTRVGDLEDSLGRGGVIDPVTGESLAVVYDGTAKDTVTLAGADGTTLANVKAGVADTDAVNVAQLKDSGLIGDDGKSIAAVTYDRNADGTPNYGTVTLGNGAGPTQLKNVAVATDDTDAVNFGQMKQYVADNPGEGGPGNPLAVAYDDASKGQVTLQGGADGTKLSNVAAGEVSATSTDAINGAQLHGTAQSVADALGGGSTVGADGTVTNPTYSLADPADGSTRTEYHNVGDALANLDGRTSTNTENITVINKQLADSGLVDPVTGQSIAAVTYDRNADGTPNRGSVTLGGADATTPVALKNVADGTDRHDAINLGQLQDAGLVAPVDPTDPGAGLKSLAVTYDGVAQDTVTLKGADGTTLANVKAGVADMDAVNVSQLKDAGLIGDDGKSIAAVTYDDATKGKVTLQGADGTTLANVKAGVADMDAVNVSQLKDSGLIGDDGKAIAAVTYDDATKSTVTLGGAGSTTPVTLKNVADGVERHDAINLGQLQDAGLVAPVDPTNPGAGLTSTAVTYDRHADGSVNFDQITLKGGADGTKLSNVAAGEVSATSTDAINGSQLHGTAQSVADSLGGGSTVGADGTVTNPTYSLADPANGSAKTEYHNVGDALANLDGRTSTNTENITVINKQLGDSGLIDPVTGQTLAAVTYDRNADGTPNRGSVTLGGADATAPVALKNVAAGVDRHDAINLGQLQDAGLVAPVDPSNPGAGLTSLAVAYDNVAKDKVTLAGADGTTLTNVKAGAVSATSTDAINGSQLYGASKSVANALGGGATVDANGNVTNPSYTVNNQTFDNVGDALDNISSSLVHGSIGLVQQDEDTRDIMVAKDTDGTTVNFAGTAGDRVLTGVAAGAVSATSSDAINGSQLHGTAQSVADTIGGGTTVDADGKLTGTSILVNGDRYKTVEEAVQAAATSGATDSMAVRYDNLDHTSVTLGGTGALAPVRLGNVADGASQYDAVNFGQLSDLRNEFDERIGGIDDRVVRLETPGGGGGGGGSGGSDYFAGTDIGTGTTPATAGTGVGNTAAGSGAVIGDGVNNGTAIGSSSNVSASNGVAIGSGAKSSAEGAAAIGSNANASGSKSAAIGEGANASGSNSVALGAGSVATSDNTVSVGSATQQRTISNLADGVNASDAATKGQLDRAMGGMQGQMNELSRNAYSGIAAATALTMIPGVDPGKTLSFGIGGATFQGYQAVAFGGEARITQNLKMKAGVGLSSGGNTVGVGASYQW
ncbi:MULTISPECIES: YadA-like family protein [Burkholderia]|uniref:YadA-like family protein n=1 Tax=Burkholderia sola TaxID=2843302 RepID=A0ABV2C8T0_9BURK